MDYDLPNPAHPDAASVGASFEECRLYAVLFANESQYYTVVLRGKNTDSVFLFETDYVQACSIYGAIYVMSSDVPRTYELFARILEATGGTMLSAVVDSFDQETHYYGSHLVLRTANGETQIKCRGSDAVGISHFAGVPLLVNAAFLGKELAR